MEKRKHQLSDLTLDEISLVDVGACPGATVEIFKRVTGGRGPGDAVNKCLEAIAENKPERLTQDDYHRAIEQVAGEIRKDGETPEAAYTRAIETRSGSLLYGAYTAAPPAELPVPIKKSDPTPESWRQIEKLADERRAARGFNVTPAQAIVEVLKENPALYDAYVTETGIDKWQYDSAPEGE